MDGASYFCLMKKLTGQHMDPFSGDCRQNGFAFGEALAKLHRALSALTLEVYETSFSAELESWILPTLTEKQLLDHFEAGVLSCCQRLASVCADLPQQIIHRDFHSGNLLFENVRFSAYLDFDITQKNARVFDICYFGCSLLVENYKDEARLAQWQEIFSGFLSGYETVRPLSVSEKRVLPGVFIYIEVLFTAFFSQQGQTALVQSCIDMTNWMHQSLKGILDV